MSDPGSRGEVAVVIAPDRIDAQGYAWYGQRRAHLVIAEEVLGRPLPAVAEVHHVNEIKSDNRHSNLVICPNAAYQ